VKLKNGRISSEGLLIALDNLDEVIALIRASQTPEEAKTGLIERFSALSELQARAILDMRLQRLPGLRDRLKEEYEELQRRIEYYKSVLSQIELRMQIIKDELLEIKRNTAIKPAPK
jgi:DNA gyrase subunit A